MSKKNAENKAPEMTTTTEEKEKQTRIRYSGEKFAALLIELCNAPTVNVETKDGMVQVNSTAEPGSVNPETIEALVKVCFRHSDASKLNAKVERAAKLLAEIQGITIDAARELVSKNPAMGF